MADSMFGSLLNLPGGWTAARLPERGLHSSRRCPLTPAMALALQREGSVRLLVQETGAESCLLILVENSDAMLKASGRNIPSQTPVPRKTGPGTGGSQYAQQNSDNSNKRVHKPVWLSGPQRRNHDLREDSNTL